MARTKHQTQQPIPFPGGGVCPKEFEPCRKCRGRKVQPFGSPDSRTNVTCDECDGEGAKLYPVHTLRVIGSETIAENEVTVTLRELLECAICLHKERRERVEGKVKADGEADQEH